MISTIIFDMDGVITDSEPLFHVAETQLFSDYGVTVDPATLTEYTGMGSMAVMQLFIDENDIDAIASDLYLDFHARVLQLFNEKVEAIPFALDLIQYFKEENFNIGLGSSSSINWIRAALHRLQISHFFTSIVSGDDVTDSKPAPDIFLKVADDLDVEPGSCVVIEDSENGVKAAKSAGMMCVGFRSPNSGNQNLAQADCIVHSLEEITIPLIHSFSN